MTEFSCNGCGRILKYEDTKPLNYFPQCCRLPMLRKIEAQEDISAKQWTNLHGEECRHIAEIIDGEYTLIVYKKRDMGGYHWSHHVGIKGTIGIIDKRSE